MRHTRLGVPALIAALALTVPVSQAWPGLASPAAAVTAGAAAGSDADWAAIQGFLPGLSPTWSAPPTRSTTDLEPDGPLMGNGDLTVSVGGDTHSQTLYLSKNDFWTSSPGKEKVFPITLGSIKLYRPASGSDSGTTYSQTQDLLNAEVRSDVWINGAPIHTRSYTSDTNGDMLVTEISTTGTSPVVLNMDVATKADNAAYPASSGISGSTLWAARSTAQVSGSQWVSRAAVATRVLGATAALRTNSSGTSTAEFTVSPGQTVTVVSAVRGGKNATTHITDAQSAVGGMDTAAVASLLTDHRAWWKAYWLKSYVRVYDATVERYYYGSQYLMGSSARAGHQAPNMWGWVTKDTPMWYGSYFLNYNGESPYYGVFSSNRPETADPYIQAIVDYQDTAKANIANLQSVPTDGEYISAAFKAAVPPSTRGYLYTLGIGPWGSTVYSGYWNQSFIASYAAVPMIYRYDYSPDKPYLSQTLYPFVQQLAQFWQDYLGAKQADGKYHLMGAPYEGMWTHDDSVSLGAINMILKSALKYSQVLGVDASMRPAWQDILDNLPAYATSTYNGKTVYTSDYDTAFTSLLGRTVCNLEWIHPLDQLDLDSPAAQRQAAIDTLDAMDSWGQANNFAKTYGIAARVGYPAAPLFAQLKHRISTIMQTNQTSSIDAGGLESISAIDAINAMMLQSVNGTIRLFPDYPAGRPGHFSNLRVQGGFLVSADHNGTSVSNVSITADNAGGPVTVLNPWPGRAITVTDAAGATLVTTQNGDRHTFTTGAGGRYTIAPQGAVTGGVLSGSVATQPAGTVDLAAQGTTDWAHWGLNSATGFDHKAGVTQAISNLTTIGSNPVLRLNDSRVTYSWTGGAPTSSATATPSAVFVRSAGNGFRITAPASTVPQRLRIYLGAWSAKGKLTASLSDDSAAVYDGYLDSPSGNGYGVADVTYAARSDGQTLTVKYVEDTAYSGPDSNVTLHAATLTTAIPPLMTIGSITGVPSGKCVDIPGGSATDGNQLQLYTCNRSSAQEWTVHPDGSVRAMGKCMDVRGGSSANGTAVQLYTCTGVPAQQWTYDPATSQFKGLGKCLDARGGGTTDGTKLQVWDCVGVPNQQWRIPS
ncbi:ricin-type beta-trefoil lectin domain protein [Nonomuraea sp. SMC257]|uniref:Ricin-type beta-trefoil lectin domain protein n=1 Tax=Nonomuraea montanisoli TaxID=2741721 RepID=A0A7Y6ICA2_9ACTN|nr:ricin-type beta-trefoil lectin domain protein [Nonomuraea montanisoli]NUW35602.1 ricin-type beta-trefoil lectin domain protein [Nonomuraea montanisoli]